MWGSGVIRFSSERASMKQNEMTFAMPSSHRPNTLQIINDFTHWVIVKSKMSTFYFLQLNASKRQVFPIFVMHFLKHCI